MDKIKIIKKHLQDHRVIYLKDNKIVLHDISKTNAKNLIIKKFQKQKKPVRLTRIEISFHRGNKFYQGGPIQLKFKQYSVFEKKINLVYEYGTSGSIWINKKFISKDIFNDKNKILKFLSMICKKVMIKKNIKIPGINLVSKFI